MATYTWVITRDVSPFESSNLVFKKGPSGATGRASATDVIQGGSRFRMLDSLGVPTISGFILGEYLGHEPLVDYGRRHGCTDIEYLSDGEWVSLDAAMLQKGTSGETRRKSDA